MTVPLPEILNEPCGIGRCQWLEKESLAEWDQFVLGHPAGTAWHLSGWNRVLHSAFPHISGSVLVIRDGIDRAIVAGIPVYSVQSWLLGNRLVTAPFATWCDPLAREERRAIELVRTLREMTLADGGRKLELRALGGQRAIEQAGMRKAVCYKHHYIRLDRDLVTISATLSRTAVRRMITKAQNAGLQIHLGGDDAELGQFCDMLDDNRTRLGLFPLPRRYLEAIWSRLGAAHRSLYVASSEGRVVAALLTLQASATFVLEYYAELPALRGSGVNQLLYWEALKAAHSAGFKVFSLGRTAPEDVGLLAYKRHWGTVEEDMPVFRMRPGSTYISPRLARQSVFGGLGHAVARMSPTWLGRWLGGMLYNHWA